MLKQDWTFYVVISLDEFYGCAYLLELEVLSYFYHVTIQYF
jgi:hypothetical protein